MTNDDAANLSAADFLIAEQTALAPLDRQTQQTIAPDAVKPAALMDQWIKFDPVFHSKWQFTINGSGTTFHANEPCPTFAIGDAQIQAYYYQTGRFVYVKLYVVTGASTFWNNLAYQGTGAGAAQWGDFADIYINLPIKAAADTYTYALGQMFNTHTTVDPGSNLVRQPNVQSAVFGNNQGIYSTNTFIKPSATEVLVNAFNSYSGAPYTYSSAAPGRGYWSAGDTIDFFIKYETDIDT